MKAILILGILSATLFSSCKKEKKYLYFTDRQLAFVNYSEGQNLKFIDTTSVLQSLVQDKYVREFNEHVGLFGNNSYTEEYEVQYRAENNHNLGFQIKVGAADRSLLLQMLSYSNYIPAILDSLFPSIPSIIIDGKTYTDVYLLKMYKNGQYVNSSDTATLFHNKQYGIIQLLFPNGKRIIRAD